MKLSVQSQRIIAAVLAVGFGWYVFFELGLALGAPWGQAAWGGQFEVLPIWWRVASAATAGFYLGLIVLMAWRIGLVRWVRSKWALGPGFLVLAGLFAVNGVLNIFSPSPLERWHALTAMGFALGCWALGQTKK